MKEGRKKESISFFTKPLIWLACGSVPQTAMRSRYALGPHNRYRIKVDILGDIQERNVYAYTYWFSIGNYT